MNINNGPSGYARSQRISDTRNRKKTDGIEYETRTTVIIEQVYKHQSVFGSEFDAPFETVPFPHLVIIPLPP